MKKALLSLMVIVFTIDLSAQIVDTNFTTTPTSSAVATWLQNLQLPSGQGRVGIYNGSMGPLALGSTAIDYVDSTNVSALYANPSVINPALQNAADKLKNYFILARRMGVYMMRAPNSFSWGMIEPDSGTYNFWLSDTIMKYAGENDIKVMGTIIPLNDYALTCNNPNPGCNNLMTGAGMYFLNNGRTGAICSADTTAYKNFITKLVERYDGDGINDMPNLIHPVTIYQIHNEPELSCAAIDSASFVDELRMSYEAIKQACPTCQVTNGGWANSMGSDSIYWKYIIQNGKDYMDFVSLHINQPRNNVFDFENYYHRAWQIIDDVSTANNKNWDIWFTEWGLYSGSLGALPYVSEEEQAARYAKWYIYGLPKKMPVYFYDQIGPLDTSNGIASSTLLYSQGINNYARLSYYTLKLMESKFRFIDSAQVISFQSDTAFSSGHIRVWKTSGTADCVWGIDSISLASYVSGVKQITDIYGNVTVQDVSTLSYPLSTLPIIIEDTNFITSTPYLDEEVKVNVFPNPFTSSTTFQITSGIIEGYELMVYDLLGNKVRRMKMTNSVTKFEKGDLQNGVYIYRITNHKQFISQGKLIIQ